MCHFHKARHGYQIYFLNIPKNEICVPNGHKYTQMAIKYNKIFHSKAFQNIPKFSIKRRSAFFYIKGLPNYTKIEIFDTYATE
jgi:hypothetical protein